jgi:hypothetical protein
MLYQSFSEVKKDIIYIVVGSSEKNWIGGNIYSDSFHDIIKDSPFLFAMN